MKPESARRLALRLFIFFIILWPLWIVLHEFLHGMAASFFGFRASYALQGFTPAFTCIGCENILPHEVLFIAILPYLVSLAAVIAYCLYRRPALWWLSSVAMFDFLWNFITWLPASLTDSLIHDFVKISAIGYWFAPAGVFVPAVLVWLWSNRLRKAKGNRKLWAFIYKLWLSIMYR